MKLKNWKIYALWIGICEVVGLVAGLLSAEGTQTYMAVIAKPPFSPPGWVFAVVWPILYALMGISAARVTLAPQSKDRSWGLNLFVAQLIVNFFWPLIFFNAQAFGFALLWLLILWALVGLMILKFRKVEPLSAWLQLPYLGWLTFAAVLNGAVWLLN